MTYVIAEPCVDLLDKACIEECPVDCIYEGARMLYIHPDECVDCGACEPVCPVEAIFYEDDLPDKWKDYTQANVDFFDELGSPGGASKVGKVEHDPELDQVPAAAGRGPLRTVPSSSTSVAESPRRRCGAHGRSRPVQPPVSRPLPCRCRRPASMPSRSALATNQAAVCQRAPGHADGPSRWPRAGSTGSSAAQLGRDLAPVLADDGRLAELAGDAGRLAPAERVGERLRLLLVLGVGAAVGGDLHRLDRVGERHRSASACTLTSASRNSLVGVARRR